MKLSTSSLGGGAALLTVTSLLGQGFGFLYRILLARTVGAETVGLYQLVLPVYSVLLSLTAVGLTAAVSTLTAKYCALGAEGSAHRVAARCRLWFFVLLLAPAAAVAAGSDAISVHLLGDARTQLGLLLLLPCLALTGLENLHKHAFYGRGRVAVPALTELGEQLVRAGAVLGLLLCVSPTSPEQAVGLIVAGMVVSEVFSALTLVFFHCRGAGAGCPRPAPASNAAIDREIFSIALPMGATALLGNLMNAANAVLIPRGLIAGGAEVEEALSAFGALSGMTLPMLTLPTAFVGAMGLVLTPRLAEHAAKGQTAAIRRRTGRAMTLTALVITPSLGLLVVLGPTAAQHLFHSRQAGEYLLPLAVGVLLSAFQGVLGSALAGLELQGQAARNALFAGGVQLAFTAGAVPLPGVGLGGYVAGFVVSDVVCLALHWRCVRRATGLAADRFRWGVAPVLATLLSALCANLLLQILVDRGLSHTWAAGVSALFAAVLYCAALQAQGVLGGRGQVTPPDRPADFEPPGR